MKHFHTLTRISFLILICIGFTTGCEKEEFFNDVHIIPGCIPSKIAHSGFLADYEENFVYEDGYIKSIGGNEYKHSNGRVTEIWPYDKRYEKYFYNPSGQVIRSEQYLIGYQETEFKLTLDFEYIYSGDQITEAIEHVDNEKNKMFYNSNSNNLDSIHTYDASGLLIRRSLYEYDNNFNPYSNLKSPLFGFFYWIPERASNHNITKLTTYNYNNSRQDRNSEYSYEYNLQGYPVKRAVGNIKRDIEYINCE